MSKIKDKTDERFGRLVVLYLHGKDKYGKSIWHCKCDCGNEVDVLASSLVTGRTKSCGCFHRDRTSESHLIDLSGSDFEMLHVESIVGKDKHGKIIYHCKCKCGNEVDVVGERLVSGNTKSCGCLSGESHKMTGTRFYSIWKNMKQRCTNVENPSYKWYGALGITVCDRWKNSFIAFKVDMYESYLDHCEKFGNKDTTLDRIDPYKDYEPSNCRWATWEEQRENKRCNYIED